MIDEAKEEYLSLEKKYLNENAKVNELENELTDKVGKSISHHYICVSSKLFTRFYTNFVERNDRAF